MNDLIGIPEAAKILNMTRSGARWLYITGEIQAVTTMGTEQRKRPVFLRQHIADVARKRAERAEHEAVGA